MDTLLQQASALVKVALLPPEIFLPMEALLQRGTILPMVLLLHGDSSPLMVALPRFRHPDRSIYLIAAHYHIMSKIHLHGRCTAYDMVSRICEGLREVCRGVQSS